MEYDSASDFDNVVIVEEYQHDRKRKEYEYVGHFVDKENNCIKLIIREKHCVCYNQG